MTYINEEPTVIKKIIKEFNFNVVGEKNIKRCLILATGSSYNACLAAKYYMEQTADLIISIQEPFDFLHFGKFDPLIDCVLVVSQSGRSTSTIQALDKILKTEKLPTYVLTGDLTSPITKKCCSVIDLNMGVEKVGFVTKGYIATVLNLMLFSLSIACKKQRISDVEFQMEKSQLLDIASFIGKIVEDTSGFFEYNKETFKSGKRFVCIGYGPNWGTAKEFETKFTETVRVPTQGFELESYMHGPYLEANKDHILFFIDTNHKISDRLHKLREYMRPYVKACYTISSGKERSFEQLALEIEKIPEKITSLFMIVPFQFLAYKISISKGIDLNKRIFDNFDEVLKSKIQ